MARRHNPSSYRSLLDSPAIAPIEQQREPYSGFRIRFFFGLLTFLVGLTGFLIVLAIAITGS